MSSRSVTRNNLVAGLFLLVALVAGVVISVVVSDAHRSLVPRSEYIVRFTVTEGAPGLRKGAVVNLGGQPVGWVSSLSFHAPDNLTSGVDVEIAILSNLVLYPNAVIHLERPLLGAVSTVNIAWPGDASAGAPLRPGTVIQGNIAPPAVLAQAGFGTDQIKQLRTILEQATEITARINTFTQRLEETVEDDLTRIRGALDDITAITSDFRARSSDWTERIDAALEHTVKATERFGPIVEEVEATIQDARRVMRSIEETIEANRGAVDRIIANAEEATTKLNEESVPLLNRSLVQASDGVAHFEEAGRKLNSLFIEQSPNIRRTLANLRLAADQFRLTSVEVRRNPWRLLYQPSTRELESELFYDAARSYAQAVSDLREASESLEAIGQADAAGRLAPTVHMETVEEIQQRLQEAFIRYEQAERNLLRHMSQPRR